MIAFFFLMFGIMEYSRLSFANNFCAYAAQQGARYASLRGSASTSPLPTNPNPCGTSCTNASSGDTTATFVQGLAVGLDTTKLTIATTWTSSTGNANAAGGTVTVKVSYAYNPLLSVVTAAMPTTLSLNSSSTMTVLQ
jgi:Flp pilus assembly protein TadG